MTTDVHRLVLQVDAAVELARKNMRDLATQVDRDATNMDASLGRVEKAHQRMGQQLAKTGQFRGGMQQLSFQVGDVAQQMALGTRASVIFAQQSGQVIQAIQLMNTGTSGFLKFLAGPWGAVLTTAGVVLATFAGKLFDNRDEVGKLVDKMREQAQQAGLNKQADEAWKRTVEGLTDAIRKRREEQEKSLKTDIQAEQESLRAAQKEAKDQAEKLADKKRELAAAERKLADVRDGNERIPAEDIRQALLDSRQRKVDQLRKDVAGLAASVTRAEQSIRGAEIVIGERKVENQLDKVKAATDAYTAALGRLRLERQRGKISQAEFERQLKAEAKTRDAAVKAAQGSSNARESGRQVSGDEAAAIARAAGLQVNSVNRSHGQQKALYDAWVAAGKPADNPVAPPGSSAHEGAKGKWAIDIQITDGVTPGSIRKLYADKGISLSKVLKERGHLHIEGSRSEAAAAETAAERAAARTREQDDAFAGQMAQLEGQLLSAQMELVTGVEAQAAFAKDQVDLEQKRFALAVEDDINSERLRAEQGKLLIERSAAVAAQKKANIEARKTVEALEQQRRTAEQESGFQIEALRFRDEMAKTQAEHRQIQLDILAALYAQREADLKIAKAKAEAAQDWEEAGRVQRELDVLPDRRARDETRTNRDTMGPLERWADGIPQTAAEMQEYFEQLQVDGINGAVDSLMALTESFESFRDTAINAIKAVIAQLLRMQLMKFMLNMMGGLGGGAGAAGGGAISGGGMGALSFAGTILGGSTSLGSLPAFLPGAASGMVGKIGGRGGIDNNILSINGRPQLKVSAGETLAVIPQVPNVRIPSAANDRSAASGGDTYHVGIHLPPGMSPREARQTGLQAGAAFKRSVSRAARKGS